MVVPVALATGSAACSGETLCWFFHASIVPALHGPGLSQRDKRYQITGPRGAERFQPDLVRES